MKRYQRADRRPTYMRQWREARGLTLAEMAQRMGLSITTLSRIETGQRPFWQDIIEDYAEILGCQQADLLTRGPSEAPELWEIWQEIPAGDRDRVVELIRVFISKPADNHADEN